jgi:3-mercaptopyruvate sulfurtransferase SseA
LSDAWLPVFVLAMGLQDPSPSPHGAQSLADLKPQPQLLVTIDDVLKAVHQSSAHFVDSRARAEFDGTRNMNKYVDFTNPIDRERL